MTEPNKRDMQLYLEMTRWSTIGPVGSDLSKEDRDYLMALTYLDAPLTESNLAKYFSHPLTSTHERVVKLREDGYIEPAIEGRRGLDLQLTESGLLRARAAAEWLYRNAAENFHGSTPVPELF